MEQIILEMKLSVPENYGKSYTTDIAEWQTHPWVKREIVQMGWITKTSEKRVRINKASKAIRIYKLLPGVFEESQRLYPETKPRVSIKGEDFCRVFETCSDCPYQHVNCEFKNMK